jgi:hypothetical protein
MNIVITLAELDALIRRAISTDESKPVRFIHKYSDGSGETDVENIARIDRIEIPISDVAYTTKESHPEVFPGIYPKPELPK